MAALKSGLRASIAQQLKVAIISQPPIQLSTLTRGVVAAATEAAAAEAEAGAEATAPKRPQLFKCRAAEEFPSEEQWSWACFRASSSACWRFQRKISSTNL